MTLGGAPAAAAWPERGEDQRCHVAIAFSDICDSTRIAGSLDPEVYADLLGRLRARAAEIIGSHGGEIVRIDGDGLISIFGYPVAHEHAGRRAVEAALDLHRAAAELDGALPPLGLRLHSGIHSGLVLLRAGDIVRGRFEMLGDATNVARRLCDAAAAGQILVSAGTLATDRHFFRTGMARSVEVPGRVEPVPALDIVGRNSIATSFVARHSNGFAPFVGREAEVGQLLRDLDTCLAGTRRAVAVIGAPGIGKTRLLSELADRAAVRGTRIYRAYCESYSGARPLQPILQLARAMLGGRGDDGLGSTEQSPHRQTLSRLLRFDQEQAGSVAEAHLLRPDLIARALLDLLTGGPEGVLLLIDDWQWADDASRQVLDRILARLEDAEAGWRGMIVLATRELDSAHSRMGAVDRQNLEPLSEAEATHMIDGLIRPATPFLAERLAASAGGNPLFIEELCHAFSGEVAPTPTRDRDIWLRMLVQARFVRLAPEQVAVIEAAAVIGNMIPAWLFEEVTGLGVDHPATIRLMHEDFLYPGELPGTLRFKHGITRDAIYSMVKLEERRALHRRVADALSLRAVSHGEDGHIDALAYHHAEAGDFARALDLAVRAGDRAMAASALDRAQAHYRAALDSIDRLGGAADPGMRTGIVRKFGLACVVDPSREHLPILRNASERALASGDGEALAWSEYWLGFLLYGLGQGRRSIRHFEAAIGAATQFGDAKLIVQIRANLGQSYAIATDYPRASALLDEAIAVKRAHRSGVRSSIGLAYSLSCRAFLKADQGGFAAADADFDEAIEVLAGIEHEMMASVLSHRAAACLWQGRLDAAEHHAGEALRIAERAHARYLHAMSRALRARARWLRDGDPEELALTAEMTRWLDSSGSKQYLSLNHGWLAEGLTLAGDVAGARRHAARAFARAREGDRLGEAMAARAMARLAAAGRVRRTPDAYLAIALRSARIRGSGHDLARTLLCEAELAGDAPRCAALRARFDDAGMLPSPAERAALS